MKKAVVQKACHCSGIRQIPNKRDTPGKMKVIMIVMIMIKKQVEEKAYEKMNNNNNLITTI